MITMYTGTPGSGKSLHVAHDIYSKLQQKNRNKVIGNFDIDMSVIKKRKGMYYHVSNYHLSPEFFYQFAVRLHKRTPQGRIIEGQTLIVIDECQILFNSRDWSAKNRMEWCTFFTQHRKYGYNIILITQFDRLVDRQIRSLVEYEVIHRNVSNYKTLGFFIGLLCGGKLFVAVTRWYSVNKHVSADYFILNKKYMRLYDSYKVFAPRKEGGTRKGAPPPQEQKPVK